MEARSSCLPRSRECGMLRCLRAGKRAALTDRGALGELQTRVASLENRQKIMLDTATGLRTALKSWDLEMAGITVSTIRSGNISDRKSSWQEWQYEVLLDVQHRLNLYKPARRSDDDKDGDDASSSHEREAPLSDRAGGGGGSWAQPLRFVIAQAIFVALGLIVRRWWKSRERHGKSL